MDIDIRPLAVDEFPAFFRADEDAFGFRPKAELQERPWLKLEQDRVRAAFDGPSVVGGGRLFSLELTVPGGASVATAGVSWIFVVPTHRRRGILTAMMRRLHDDAAERDAPVLLLTASEGGIYGRFGYGVATRVLGVTVDRRAVRFAVDPPPARRRLVEPKEARTREPEIFERARRARPGAVSRPDQWWDGEQWDDDLGARFDVIVETDDGEAGYVAYHFKGDWSEGVPGARLEVRDLVATGPAAEAALWHYLCGVDLVQEVHCWSVPVDFPLPWQLVDARAVRPTSWRDFLWARLADVPAALGARSYSASGRVVVEVDDPFGDSGGRFELDGGPDGAAAGPTTADPDLCLGIADLGAIWLGDVAPSTLARAGRIRGADRAALARADAMFATERAPCALTWF